MKPRHFLTTIAGTYVVLAILLTALMVVVAERLAHRTGLHRQVYAEVGFSGAPLLDDISDHVTLDFLHHALVPTDVFSVRWHGFWYSPKPGVIELHSASDDRADLWIDDQPLFRQTPPAGPRTAVRRATLEAGIHEVLLEYSQYRASPYPFRFHWVPQGEPPQPLPPKYLFRERPRDDDIELARRLTSLQRLVQILWVAPLAIGLVWFAITFWTPYRLAATAVTVRPSSRTYSTRVPLLLAGSVWLVAIWVFLNNAWVTEDAYILFRSVEQVFAGNGPVWNPHERVQVYTSPLWFWILVFSRLISANLYLNSIIISLALWIFTLRNLQRIAPTSAAFAMGFLLCAASTAIHDYTSSGFENVLAYGLLTYFFLQIVRLYRDGLPERAAISALGRLCLMFGLIALTRHDLVLLLLPPAAFVVWDHRRLLSIPTYCTLAVVALLPLATWTLFSLIYYGFPWPNTAYAKLNTGVDRADVALQGFRYLLAAILQDAVTPLIIVAALVITYSIVRHRAYKFIAAGVILNLIYVVLIGGDYMLGRFLSFGSLIAVCLLVLELPRLSFSLVFLPRAHLGKSLRLPLLSATVATSVVVLTYAIAYHHTPLNCWRPSSDHVRPLFGIGSDRDGYSRQAFRNYLAHTPGDNSWPDHDEARIGREIRESSNVVHEARYIGMRGYMAGTDKIIVDRMALSDPLLARLPVTDDWSTGHFPRTPPNGYLERLAATKAMSDNPRAYGLFDSGNEIEHLKVVGRMFPIAPPELNEFYNKLAIITQTEDLWSAERLKTILLFNLGTYDHLARPQHDDR